ncbi:hypothetical protein IFM89_008960 [Coptis chinensis]|uniref:Vacuolar iron transporter n=1 Tax=Coptis chinensis TaxID=261450 RepID=A0A835M4E3_9MAGN|nr:hypothetical protein IFM89_008960 [Coptis chinensis]
MEGVEMQCNLISGQWLRAAIPGSNDGLLSTTSLMLGMAAASKDRWDMILVGVVAAVAGACSMAVGEYVSLATQRDIEGQRKTETNRQLTKRGSVYATSPGKSPLVREGCHQRWNCYICRPKRSPLMRVISEEERALTTDNDYETLPNPMKVACASGLAFLCGSL